MSLVSIGSIKGCKGKKKKSALEGVSELFTGIYVSFIVFLLLVIFFIMW